MRATEMHDLLKACYVHLTAGPVYENGKGAFASIRYCKYCGYSDSYPHGDSCLIGQLERATSVESEKD